MESLKLNEFFRTLNSWPKQEAELGIAAEAVRKFTRTPFAAIALRDGEIRVSGIVSSDAPMPDSAATGAQALVRTHLEQLLGAPNGLEGESFTTVARARSISLSAEITVGNGAVAQSLLAYPIIVEWNATGVGIAGNREQLQLGWLLVGVPRATNAANLEARLVLIAQHLASLGVRARLEAALNQRDQFLSIASHELKTPLTSIYGILQLQERMLRPRSDQAANPLDQERQHSFFKIVIRQVERLNELIDALLDVSRICNGRFSVEPSDTDVVAIIAETVSNRLTVIGLEAGVKIETELPVSLRADVDPIRFEEVVTNLGMNAIRFSPEGGTVRIRLEDQGESLVLSFRDQGPSVPEVDRIRIFQPFERAQRTTRLGGLGLGLFISKQIAQMHGGDVFLSESQVGKGNLFEAHFPRTAVQRATA